MHEMHIQLHVQEACLAIPISQITVFIAAVYETLKEPSDPHLFLGILPSLVNLGESPDALKSLCVNYICDTCFTRTNIKVLMFPNEK